MRVSKTHPVAGWLRVTAGVYSQSLDQVLRHRDEQLVDNPSASGLPPASRDWFWSTQLPELMTCPSIHNQVLTRLAELAAKRQAIEDQLRQQAGSLIEEQSEIDAEVALLQQVLP